MLSSQVNHLQKELQNLKNQKSKQDEGEDLFLSNNLALLMYEAPLIEKVICDDLPYSSEVRSILQEQCYKLDLNPMAMEKELLQSAECEGFLFYNDMSPRGQLMTFMCSKELGPKAQGLYDALKLTQALTDDQKTLLQKICIKMGHPDWPELIIDDIEEEIAAREQGYEQQSPATGDRSLPGRLPGDQY